MYLLLARLWRFAKLYWLVVPILLAGFITGKLLPISEHAQRSWAYLAGDARNPIVDTMLWASVIGIIFVLFRRWMLDDGHTARSEAGDAARVGHVPPHYLLDDAPIPRAEEDELERMEFARNLAPMLVLPNGAKSIVVALEAPWGEGKTSFITLVSKVLRTHPDNPVVVRFSPWYLVSADQLVRAFLSHLLAEVEPEGSRAHEAVKELANYADALEVILPSGAGAAIGTILAGSLKPVNLQDSKDQLERALQLLGRPIVVVIDDIDRLPKEEIRLIFQLVKNVCDFARVAYLLAFDPRPVDRALTFDGMYDDGRDYRDKIVQASVPLPRITYSQREMFLTTRLAQRLESWQLDPDGDDTSVLEAGKALVCRMLRTPREVKRVLNAFCIACKNLRGEVNCGDILVFEALRLRFPNVANEIQRRPQSITRDRVFDEEKLISDYAREVDVVGEGKEGWREQLLKDFQRFYPDPGDSTLLEDVLRFLFPESMPPRESAQTTRINAPRRLASYEALGSYLSKGLTKRSVSAKSIKAFVEGSADRAALIEDPIATNTFAYWFSYLEREIPYIETRAVLEMLRVLNSAANTLWARSRVSVIDDIGRLAARLLPDLGESDTHSVLTYLTTGADSIALGEDVLMRLLRQANMWKGGKYFWPERGDSLRNKEGVTWITANVLADWTARWRQTAGTLSMDFLMTRVPDGLSVLFRMGQFESPPYALVRRSVASYLTTPEAAKEFANQFGPGMSTSGVEFLVEDQVRFLTLLDQSDADVYLKDKFKKKDGG